MDAVRLSRGEQHEWVIGGVIFPGLSLQADLIAANKFSAKAFLSGMGIPVPESSLVSQAEKQEAEIRRFLEKHHPAVLKPLNGTDGDAIRLDMESFEAVKSWIDAYSGKYPDFLLEERISGHDIRIQAIGGKVAAACTRIPCTVYGDGKLTVSELIVRRQTTMSSQNPDNHIRIDAKLDSLLVAQGMTMDEVPEIARPVRLSDLANMSQGAIAVDVTDRLHPVYHEWVTRIGEALRLSVFAVDGITPDEKEDPRFNASRILEFNVQPAWLHHTFSEGRQHDIPTMILKDLFHIS
jgi:cyanophycin synthetase